MATRDLDLNSACAVVATLSEVPYYFFTGALLITSGLLLNMCVCAMLIIKPRDQILKGNNCAKSKLMQESSISQNAQIVTEKKDSFEMLVSLFSNTYFILMFISDCVFMFGVAIMYTHFMAFAESQGVSSSLRSLIISLIGFSSLLGRIALGMLSQHPNINTIMLYIAAVFPSGKC